MKKLLFCVSLFLTFLSSASLGALSDYNIYFINGINASLPQAKESRDKLRNLVLPDVPDGNVQTLYQNNDRAWGEMIEVVRQQASADNERHRYKVFWKCVNDPSPETCDPGSPPSKSLRRVISRTLAKYDEAAYVQNPQLQAMVGVLRDNYYNKRKKALLVSHSQGNFYANQVVNYLQSFDPAVAACVEVVGVASPATYVAKSGPYDTRSDDDVINAARADFPWGGSILPATWAPPFPAPAYPDPSHHTFVASYLGPGALRQRIRNNIVLQTASAADSACVLPQACKTLRTSGGQGGYQLSHFLGQDAKTVNMRFDFTSGPTWPNDVHIVVNPDRYGSRIFNYYSSASHWSSFRFDPAQMNGATGVEISLGVSPSITWGLCIDCGDGSCQ